MARIILTIVAAAVALGGCAAELDGARAEKVKRFGGYVYHGSAFAEPRGMQNAFGGYGADFLDPWLLWSEQGRHLVTFGYADARGAVSAYNARRANSWFRALADANGDKVLTDEEIALGLRRGILQQYSRFFSDENQVRQAR